MIPTPCRGLVVLALLGITLTAPAQTNEPMAAQDVAFVKPLATGGVVGGLPMSTGPQRSVPAPLDSVVTQLPEAAALPPVTIVPGLPGIDSSAIPGDSDAKVGAWLIEADYLLMATRRRGDDYAVVGTNTYGGPVGVLKSLDGSYDSGFRLGVGYRFPGEGMEVMFRYTFLHNTSDQSITPPPGQILFATATHPAQGDQFASAAASDSINLNLFDVEIAKRFAISESLNGRLFAGPHFANIDQKFAVTYQGGDIARDEVRRRLFFDGGGVRAGGEINWQFFDHLGSYFRGSASLLTGRFRGDLTETGNGASIVNVSDKFTRVIPVLDMGLGLVYQRAGWRLSVGYEFMTWFDMVDGIDFVNDFHPAKLGPRTGNLGFDGIVFRSEYSF